MANVPLMPKATAVWLVDNTALTFEQIAEFCQLHDLEVKGIADGDVAQGIRGMDPVSNDQLSRDEIARGQQNPDHKLQLSKASIEIPEVKTKKGPKYTPLSRRQDRPTAIAWLVRNHPELRDSEIMKLVGTTKPTIQAIRDRTHWNSSNLQPQDPVILGLCTQIELDGMVKKAGIRAQKDMKVTEEAGTLLPASQTQAPVTQQIVPKPVKPEPEPVAVDAVSVFGKAESPPPSDADSEEPAFDPDSVFAKLSVLNEDAKDAKSE